MNMSVSFDVRSSSSELKKVDIPLFDLLDEFKMKDAPLVLQTDHSFQDNGIVNVLFETSTVTGNTFTARCGVSPLTS
jgi:hypothetical protein